MTSPSSMLHAVLGSPRVDGCVDLEAPSLCWICGDMARRALARAAWLGAKYTGQNKVRAPSSPWICEPCVHLHSRVAPVPGRPAAEGKAFGGNFRNYSHLYEQAPGGVIYANASKGQKPVILAFLRRPKLGLWWAAIADSGQKHVVPWAPLNGPGAHGRILFDEQVVELPDAAGWALVDEMIALLTACATKEEIGGGAYGPGAWSRCRDAIVTFEARHSGRRHGAWFGLALWLAQRDESAVAERQKNEQAAKAAKGGRVGRRDEGEVAYAHGRGAARDASRVPRERREPAEALGADPGPGPERGAPVAVAGGVGDVARARASATGAQQLSIPGCG